MDVTAPALSLAQIILDAAPLGVLLALLVLLPSLSSTAAWWEKPSRQTAVGVFFALAGVGVYVASTHDWGRVWGTALDYGAFLMVMASLFVVSGGIRLSGSFQGTPGANTAFLLAGALLSNLLGTTGASLLLIRPFLRANRHRQDKAHLVVFFIFIVSNGGAVLPLGPPLYLGFLKQVPFFWNLNLVPAFGFWTLLLLTAFYLVDRRYCAGDKGADQDSPETLLLRLEG